jgi:8-oxo-dGTP pyrophosphatase MutT (NUDIX family)
MVEHTRAHPRLLQEPPRGRREQLTVGALFIPAKLEKAKRLPLFVHFHGASWVAEIAAARSGRTAVISVQTGSGSSAYANQFSDRGLFDAMLREAAEKTGITFGPISLTAWSAGHGAIREILSVPGYYARVQKVLLLDGLHAGYVKGKPGPLESELEPDHLEIFLQFARDAVAGRKTMIVTHSEIFPGTFASTTETADWLVAQLGLRRRAILRWGPSKTQQLSEARSGKFLLMGYAGNSAPDHVDEFHGLSEYLKLLR